MSELVDYSSVVVDNLRWRDFQFRPGDVVIVADSKSGTTWTQQLVGSLIFGGELPDSISALSPWVDMTTRSAASVFSFLDSQTHRRFMKTHTPLDGVQWSDDVRYVCVGRDPRDAAISMVSHYKNLDFEAMTALTTRLDGTYEAGSAAGDLDPDVFIRGWLTESDDSWWPFSDTAAMYLQMWNRRRLPNVELFHFEDYLTDLPREVSRLSEFLGIQADPELVAAVVAGASLESMRAKGSTSVPEDESIWLDPAAFFRSGRSGQWRAYMTDDDERAYGELLARWFPPDLAEWATHGWGPKG